MIQMLYVFLSYSRGRILSRKKQVEHMISHCTRRKVGVYSLPVKI